MKFFLNLLERMGRKRIIMDRVDNEPYLERYYLFLKDRENFPFNVFLHKFLKGDPDDVHDHPWSYLTIVLKGGYYEHTPIFNKDGKQLSIGKSSKGYLSFNIRLSKGSKPTRSFVHRLQAFQKFGEKIFKDGIVVRHLNGVSTDNSYDNIGIGLSLIHI